MFLVGTNQLCGAFIEFGILPADGTIERIGTSLNLLAMPAIGNIALLLTRHSTLSKETTWGPFCISGLLILLYGVTELEIFSLLVVSFSIVYVGGVGIISYTYYWRYNKALRESYANIEDYDISWLGVLVVLLVLAASMRIFMVSFDTAAVHILALCFNIFVWAYLSRMISFVRDAKEMGSVSSILDTRFSFRDIIKNRRIVKQTDSESYNDAMGQNIKHVCIDNNLLGDFNFNSQSLSNHLDCTKGELSDYFSSHDTTFFNFINNLRLEYAADLLVKTNKSSLEIGETVGFRFDNNFRHQFEDKYNCTPSEYRRQNKQ